MVGTYSPVAKPAAVKLDHARIEHWIKNGAQPSDTVARLGKHHEITPEVLGLLEEIRQRRSLCAEAFEKLERYLEQKQAHSASNSDTLHT